MQPQHDEGSEEILTDLDDLQFDETGRMDNELGLEEDDSFLDKDWEDGPVTKPKQDPKDPDIEEF